MCQIIFTALSWGLARPRGAARRHDRSQCWAKSDEESLSVVSTDGVAPVDEAVERLCALLDFGSRMGNDAISRTYRNLVFQMRGG